MAALLDSEIVDCYKSSQVFPLLEEPIDLDRHLKVAIIGCGYSGICAAYKLSRKLKNVDLVLYDKNSDFGGTWIENTYPGVSCDIPSHAYQYSFAPNPDWSRFYSGGAEILRYLQNCADKLSVRPFAKFHHEITNAEWVEEQGGWKLNIRDNYSKNDFSETVDIVLTATGFLNNWKWPDIAGLETFKGKVVHTADWTLEPLGDPVWKDRRVPVIGCGSSGTQVVPELQPHVKHLYNYVRGKTWISQSFAMGFLQKYPDWEIGNHVFTDEEKRIFREHPEVCKEMLMQLEDYNHSVHSGTHVGTKIQAFLRFTYEAKMRQRLSSRPDIADTLIPDFPIICRRMTPGIGYLESLCAENVTFVPSPITRVTPDGIEITDGSHHPCDVIVTATGFDTTYIPRFPIIGQQQEDLRDKWKQHPVTYIGLCQDNFPNWFQISGPNSGVATGSLIMTIEAQSDYVVACIQKLQRQRIKYMVPKKQAVDDFQAYLDSYFPKTVWARKCRTWYKAGKENGKVTALWPGSSLHQYQALQQPRFEDFDYEYLYGGGDPAKANGLYWFGNGFSLAEQEDVPGTRGWRIGQAFSTSIFATDNAEERQCYCTRVRCRLEE